jgi:hypothetical protein
MKATPFAFFCEYTPPSFTHHHHHHHQHQHQHHLYHRHNLLGTIMVDAVAAADIFYRHFTAARTSYSYYLICITHHTHAPHVPTTILASDSILHHVLFSLLPLLLNGLIPILLDIVIPRISYLFSMSRFCSDISTYCSHPPNDPPTSTEPL